MTTSCRAHSNSNHPTDSPSEVLWRLEFVQNLAEDIKTAALEDDKLENCTIHRLEHHGICLHRAPYIMMVVVYMLFYSTRNPTIGMSNTDTGS